MLLREKLKPYRLMLASRSPRRRELMSGCGLEYQLAPDYLVEEHYPDSMGASQVPLYLSKLKSEAYPFDLHPGEILITADTVVIVEDQILGKPRHYDQAVAMLNTLSGRSHEVITGVTLRSREKICSFSTCSKVFFKPLSPEEIDYYIKTHEPFDKAGSYGIQEWIGYVAIYRIEGSFYNVVGLPIQQLYEQLNNFIAP